MREPQQEPPSLPESAPAAQPAGAPPGPELSELDALEHDLDVSERRLEEHLRVATAQPASAADSATSDGEVADEPGSAEGTAAPRASAPAPEPQPRAPPKREERRQEHARADDACALSCRALASMRRAAESICELVPGAPRCLSATGRVERAERKVHAADCACNP